MLPIERLLENYKTQYPQEVATADRILNYIRSEARCFEKHCPTAHITGSAWLINRERSAVLLTHHAKLNKWMQLGGHSDGDSQTWEVALREAREESGIDNIRLDSQEIFDIDIHLIPERKNEAAHYHYDIRFVCQTVDTDNYVVSPESKDLKWVPFD